MRNYKQEGDIVTLIAPYAVSPGDGVLVGTLFGVALTSAALGANVETLREGVLSIAKPSTEVWATGDLVYWNNTTRLATKVGAGAVQIGAATEPAANPSSTGAVLLLKIGVDYYRDPVTGGNELFSGGKKILSAQTTRNFVGTRILTSGIQGGFATAAAAYTWSLQIGLPVDFAAVRLVFLNGITSDITGVTACASAGGTLSDRNNNAGTWTNATFAGAASTTLPLAAGTTDPTITVSDWIPVTSIARVDGGTTRLVYVRAYIPGSNANVSLMGFGASTANWNSKADGYTWCPRYQIGDFVTTPSGMTGSSDPISSPIAGIQYISKAGVLHYLAFGDSITNSAQTTIRGESFAFRATRDAGFTLGAFGADGQTTAQILARAQRIIPVLRPTHAMYPIFTPNDGAPTATTTAAQFARALQFVDLCAQNGVVPILWTGLPKTTDITNATASWSIGQDDLRKALNNAFANIGIELMDMAAVMSDTTAPGVASKWASASLLYDGTHPNDAGQEAMRAVAALSLAKY